jgi:hypothetical protein
MTKRRSEWDPSHPDYTGDESTGDGDDVASPNRDALVWVGDSPVRADCQSCPWSTTEKSHTRALYRGQDHRRATAHLVVLEKAYREAVE